VKAPILILRFPAADPIAEYKHVLDLAVIMGSSPDAGEPGRTYILTPR
jgi:hypothetical protein